MDCNLPLVSIVMPVHNGASKGMLQDAIISCLNQSYTNIELILVDDCSTDDTYECFEKFVALDRRVRIIRNTVNKKLPASLNIGFEQACGKYYTWTSDDNFYLVSAIEEMVLCLENNQDVDITYTNFICVNKQKQQLKTGRVGKSELLCLYNCIGACFLYKREVHIALGGYDTNLFLVEDYDFWLRAYNKFKYMYIDKTLYYYTEHGDSLSVNRYMAVREADLQLARRSVVSNDRFDITNRRRRCWYAMKESIKYIKPALAIYFLLKHLSLSAGYCIKKLKE